MTKSFTPTIKFVEQTPADRLAVSSIYAIQEQIRDTMNTERSKKRTIGISEIGNPCDACIVRKLSELYDEPAGYGDGWKAQVGTFCHAGLDEHFSALAGQMAVGDKQLAIYPERKLEIYRRGDFVLNGTGDFFITDGETFGMVADWKFQGPKVLAESARGKVKPVYEVQIHTYGFGYELLGLPITHVCLYPIPRDGELYEAAPIVMPYDRDIAVNAIARIEKFLVAHELLVTMNGGDPVAAWEQLLLAQTSHSGCYDCRRMQTSQSDNFWDGFGA